MAKKCSKHASPVAAAGSSRSILVTLDEDALVEVLRAAKAAGVLQALASSSKQLCSLARSRVPLHLKVHTHEDHTQALLALGPTNHGTPPFSACTRLYVAAGDLSGCLMAVCILNTAQQWTALVHLELWLDQPEEQLQLEPPFDYCAAAMLSGVPALKQLRSLELNLPDLRAASAGHIGQAVQLTALTVQLLRPDFTLAASDLGALSRLRDLKELVLKDTPMVQPAAGPEGPFCFPSSLTYLMLADDEVTDPNAATMAYCLTHLPGCPQLQHLELAYGNQQHPSAHPEAVVALLAQHQPQLRMLKVWCDGYHEGQDWDLPVEGLADATGAVPHEWHPSDTLAALTGLECLVGTHMLSVHDTAEWQHLASLTALTKLACLQAGCAPPQLPGVALAVLELKDCWVELDGRDLGRLLLACPVLQRATILIRPWEDNGTPRGQMGGPAEGARLALHPSLQSLRLQDCHKWGVAAPVQFAALAPVLGGVSDLFLENWRPSSRGQRNGGLPDLSPCKALTALVFTCLANQHEVAADTVPQEQEDFLSMVAPLVQLQRLEVHSAPRVNARLALVLQPMLPQLKHLKLWACGVQLPLSAGSPQQQQQEEVLGKVRQLLRPGLLLVC
jgi:hypothetical protein